MENNQVEKILIGYKFILSNGSRFYLGSELDMINKTCYPYYVKINGRSMVLGYEVIDKREVEFSDGTVFVEILEIDKSKPYAINTCQKHGEESYYKITEEDIINSINASSNILKGMCKEIKEEIVLIEDFDETEERT